MDPWRDERVFFAKIAMLWGSYWTGKGKAVAVAWFSGAVFLMIKIHSILGGFDERFFLYKEEEDLCLRLRQKKEGSYYTIRSISVLIMGAWLPRIRIYGASRNTSNKAF